MMIEELKLGYGSEVVIKRLIQHPNPNNPATTLSLDFINGEVAGATFSFNGRKTSTTSSETIEELRRFKALLNSFGEL